MKFAHCLAILSCLLWETMGYPYYPYYGNVDSVSYGSVDSTRGGVALSRYYNPYYSPRVVGGGMAAFMIPQQQPQSGQYYLPDRRRQTVDFDVPPQQNEIYYPQRPQAQPQPEVPALSPTEPTELTDATEKADVIPTTLKAVTTLPEIIEPEVPDVEEVAEPAPKPKKGVARRKQVKKPVEDDEDDEDFAPRMPAAAFFPMFFGYGGRAASGGPGGPTAIANAYSTGRGGVATSHATAYGAPRPEERFKNN